jgi:hypothetical protein
MTIDLIRQVIAHLYTTRNPTTMHPWGTEQSVALVNSMLNSAAA